MIKTFEAIGVEVKYDGARSIRKDWKGRKIILIKLKDLGENNKVMKNKNKLVRKEFLY